MCRTTRREEISIAGSDRNLSIFLFFFFFLSSTKLTETIPLNYEITLSFLSEKGSLVETPPPTSQPKTLNCTALTTHGPSHSRHLLFCHSLFYISLPAFSTASTTFIFFSSLPRFFFFKTLSFHFVFSPSDIILCYGNLNFRFSPSPHFFFFHCCFIICFFVFVLF